MSSLCEKKKESSLMEMRTVSFIRRRNKEDTHRVEVEDIPMRKKLKEKAWEVFCDLVNSDPDREEAMNLSLNTAKARYILKVERKGGDS